MKSNTKLDYNDNSLDMKGIITAITKNPEALLNTSAIKAVIVRFIDEEFNKGLSRAEREINATVDVMMPNNSQSLKQMLWEYVESNTQKALSDMASNIRQVIQRGLMDGDDPREIAKELTTVFKEKKYLDRIKMIYRTESVRANNMGALEGAKQLDDIKGIKIMKYLDVVNDVRTTTTCQHENAKYGSKDKAIPHDEPFTFTFQNKKQKAQAPPFHPNCRTAVRFFKLEVEEQ